MSGNYPKLDSFLKRVLNNAEYKEVKTHEPCVVVSPVERNKFRFVFLTNERIYITENPPKTLLYHVDIEDIISVNTVQDVAEFLQHQLREHVQHIVIEYKSSSSGENSSGSLYGTDQFKSSTNNGTHTAILGSSSSSEVPLLCSFSQVTTVDHVSNLNSNRNGLVLAKSSLIQPKKQVEKKEPHVVAGSWENRDPYITQVPKIDPSCIVNQLHLYILDENTCFPLMLQSLWRNFIIYHSSQSKLSLIKHKSTSPNFDSSTDDSSADESIRCLFSQLKQELLYADEIEDLFRLYHELKNASSRDILIKSLFWKDDALFRRALQLMDNFVISSNASNMEDRAEEIELLTIGLQTLGIMMREVDGVPQCLRVLQNLNLTTLKEIIELLLTEPTLSSEMWSSDKEMQMLIVESVMASSEVLYHFFNLSVQIRWTIPGRSAVFNAATIFKLIDENPSLSQFLDNVVHACVAEWQKPINRQSGFNKAFSDEESINAFHMLSVLHRICSRSDRAAEYAKENYQEEFRYYINPTTLNSRFPQHHKLSEMARAVVHATGFLVLGT